MNLRLEDVACLTAFPCALAGAQLLFKIAAAPARGRSPVAALAVIIRHPSFYVAGLAYAAASLLWLWILGRYSLTLAYPFTAIAFVLIPLMEKLLYGVRAAPRYWLGLVMILGGAMIVARAKHG